jgi:hypothetical protein
MHPRPRPQMQGAGQFEHHGSTSLPPTTTKRTPAPHALHTPQGAGSSGMSRKAAMAQPGAPQLRKRGALQAMDASARRQLAAMEAARRQWEQEQRAAADRGAGQPRLGGSGAQGQGQRLLLEAGPTGAGRQQEGAAAAASAAAVAAVAVAEVLGGGGQGRPMPGPPAGRGTVDRGARGAARRAAGRAAQAEAEAGGAAGHAG